MLEAAKLGGWGRVVRTQVPLGVRVYCWLLLVAGLGLGFGLGLG